MSAVEILSEDKKEITESEILNWLI